MACSSATSVGSIYRNGRHDHASLSYHALRVGTSLSFGVLPQEGCLRAPVAAESLAATLHVGMASGPSRPVRYVTDAIEGRTQGNSTQGNGGSGRDLHWWETRIGKRGRGSERKAPVVALVGRGGRIRTRPAERVSAKALKSAIRQNVRKDARIMTDDFSSYHGLG